MKGMIDDEHYADRIKHRTRGWNVDAWWLSHLRKDIGSNLQHLITPQFTTTFYRAIHILKKAAFNPAEMTIKNVNSLLKDITFRRSDNDFTTMRADLIKIGALYKRVAGHDYSKAEKLEQMKYAISRDYSKDSVVAVTVNMATDVTDLEMRTATLSQMGHFKKADKQDKTNKQKDEKVFQVQDVTQGFPQKGNNDDRQRYVRTDTTRPYLVVNLRD